MTAIATILPVEVDAIPAELRALDRWVLYDRKKHPKNARYGNAASSTDQETWASFAAAINAFEGSRNGRYAGVGFVLTVWGPYCGIDLDYCIDESGRIHPNAQKIIDRLNSYTEISPSGRGVHIFIKGRKQKRIGKDCQTALEGMKKVEVYDRDRYFTMTGRHLPGTPTTIEDRQDVLDALMNEWFGPPVAHAGTLNGTHTNGTTRNGTLTAPALPAGVPDPAGARGCLQGPSDDEVLKRISADAQIARLFGGDPSAHKGTDKTPSGGSLALCNHLARFTEGNAEQMDRLFRRSGLMRAKWDEKRGNSTWGADRIKEALASYHAPYRMTTGSTGSTGTNGTNGTATKRERLVLDPRRTLPTAQAFLDDHHAHADRPTLLAWCGSFYEWRAGGWQELDDAALRARMTAWLHQAAIKTKDGLAPFPANPASTAAAIETLRDSVHLSAATELPCWLAGGADRPRADELLATRSGLLHLPTGSVIPPTPMLFTTAALPFDFDPSAPRPERWLRFLSEVFDDDAEAIQLAREWAGYILTPDTRQHKIMLAVGPKRSGKGTFAGVLAELAGAGNFAAPTTSSLAGTFGLQPLLGRSLAIIGDARFRGRDTSVVVERLLTISGGDPITVDQKYTQSVTTRLPVRFVILSNELPRLADAAGALASRFLILPFRRSFIGAEDTRLADALREELPGVLNWAIEGWKTLNARGRFVQPASAADMQAEIEDLGAPVAAFVRDRCEVGAGLRVGVDELHMRYCEWAVDQGIQVSDQPDKRVFGRELSAAFPSIVKRRTGAGGAGGAVYVGVAIR